MEPHSLCDVAHTNHFVADKAAAMDGHDSGSRPPLDKRPRARGRERARRKIKKRNEKGESYSYSDMSGADLSGDASAAEAGGGSSMGVGARVEQALELAKNQLLAVKPSAMYGRLAQESPPPPTEGRKQLSPEAARALVRRYVVAPLGLTHGLVAPAASGKHG